MYLPCTRDIFLHKIEYLPILVYISYNNSNISIKTFKIHASLYTCNMHIFNEHN